MLNITNQQGKTNQNHLRYHFTLVKMASFKRREITSVGKNTEKSDFLCTASENLNWHIHCGKQYRVSLKKNQVEIQHDPVNSLLVIRQRKGKEKL